MIDRHLPGVARKRPGHPAKRVFQALRIEVNHELDVLVAGLEGALGLLMPKGRCVVLSYHSGEDRLVKQCFLDAASGGCVCPPGLPCVCGAIGTMRVLTRGARLPNRRRGRPKPASLQCQAAGRRAPRARSGLMAFAAPDASSGARGLPVEEVPSSRPDPGAARPTLDVVDRRLRASSSTRRQAKVLKALGALFVARSLRSDRGGPHLRRVRSAADRRPPGSARSGPRDAAGAAGRPRRARVPLPGACHRRAPVGHGLARLGDLSVAREPRPISRTVWSRKRPWPLRPPAGVQVRLARGGSGGNRQTQHRDFGELAPRGSIGSGQPGEMSGLSSSGRGARTRPGRQSGPPAPRQATRSRTQARPAGSRAGARRQARPRATPRGNRPGPHPAMSGHDRPGRRARGGRRGSQRGGSQRRGSQRGGRSGYADALA